MANVVCKNCGTKNPSSAASCSNCGQFLMDDQSQRQSSPQSFTTPSSQTEQPTPEDTVIDSGEPVDAEPYQQKPYDGPVETVKVPGGNSSQWIGMFSGFVILGIFLVIEYLGIPLPTYTLYGFIVLIFIIPTLLRRSTSAIKVNQFGFSIPNAPEMAPVDFENILNAKLGVYTRYEQSLTLYFKGTEPALKLDFTSMINFRTLVMSLNRRRIPIVRDPVAGQTAQQPTA